MIVLRLLPDQIMRHWELIKKCILQSHPPHIKEDSESLLRVQEALLLDSMQCWVAAETLHAESVYGIATTKVVFDECSGTKNLLIYSATILSHHPDDMWLEGVEAFRKFATARGCNGIIAFSNNATMVALAQTMGADTSWHLLQFSI